MFHRENGQVCLYRWQGRRERGLKTDRLVGREQTGRQESRTRDRHRCDIASNLFCIVLGRLGVVSRPLGIVLGRLGIVPRRLGIVSGPLGIVLGPLGTVLGPLDIVLGRLGIVSRRLGTVLGPLGTVLGPLGIVLGPLDIVLGRLGIVSRRLGTVLGPLGTVLGPLGIVLGPLGIILGPLGIVLTNVMFTRFIPMLFAAVAMAPLVAMVTGQTPSEPELQEAFRQARAEITIEAAQACHGPCPAPEDSPYSGALKATFDYVCPVCLTGPAPEDSPYSGALNALALEHRSTPMAIQLGKSATVLEKVAKRFMDSSRPISYTVVMLATIDSPTVTGGCDDTSMEPVTCPTPADPELEFRSANGRCNNRGHPLWGSAEQPFRRLLEPDYEDDLMTPRTTGRGGAALPSARLVSTTVHQDLRKSSPVNTHMVAQFGQFLDHDITLTPNFAEVDDDPLELEEVFRCDCDSVDERCFNIPVPSDDPDFGGRRCLEFARSRSCPNEGCRMGRRQQLNQITAFVDASNVYGSSEGEIEELRQRSEPRAPSGPRPVTLSKPIVCTQGWSKHGSRCFRVFTDKMDYAGAKAACRSEGGSLAMPTDKPTNDLLVRLRNGISPTVPVWIGLNDIQQEGRFVWEDGQVLGSFTGWAFDEPNNQPHNNGDCVRIDKSTSWPDPSWRMKYANKWRDYPCDGRIGFICEKAGSGPNEPITQACSNPQPLGMESGAIPDDSITASSSFTLKSRAPFHGRLNAPPNRFWVPKRNKRIGEWLQVDLGGIQRVTGTIIQGSGANWGAWVRSYKLQYSADGTSWTTYGSEKVFPGNTNAGGRVTNLLDHPVDARYVRFVVQSWKYYIALRVEILGCRTGKVQTADTEEAPGRGLLKSRPNPADANKKEFLPGTTEEESGCPVFAGPETCSQAGDIRVNEQPGLTSMHTVFLREHNRIARRLSQLNPRWDDDRVFLETRKIVGALMQKITYGEDLPHVLGPDAMAKFHLTLAQSGFFSGYDPSVNPTISNVFATAAYRFGHSLVQGLFRRHDPDFNPSSLCPIELAFGFFNPSHIFNNDQGGPDSIIRGLTAQPHQDFDRFMVSGLTKRLFADPPGSDRGLDLAALNIQRGRDHGLPGYNAWREKCGLPKANSFDDLAFEITDCSARKRLESLYRHVDDIDVFVGGLAEESVPGGVVGPTFACLIGLQFQDLRKGDRFWFENPDQFTEAQLAEIRKTSLARILCDNTDGTTRMQPDVFLQPTQPGNERVACSSLPQMDLTKWRQ
ncbi:PXDN [Branchiostoma lanceolatum]|uniref:PXDN protein n=1 Tax=Branchiostoma lanceolatum TaxID=7740 RepID=A0A8K0F1R7_BRALA|nr:PXDN [Branchiostoma lanceolatum]